MRRALAFSKEWGGIISVAAMLLWVPYWFGRVESSLEDAKRLREDTARIPGIAKDSEEVKGYLRGLTERTERMATDIALIRAKVNDEIIPRLNGEQKLRPVASPLLGIPVPREEAVAVKVLSWDQVNNLPAKFGWVAPYQTVRPNERLADIIKAHSKAYGTTADPAVTLKLNKPVLNNPDSIPAGTHLVIPLEKIAFGETLTIRKKEITPPN